MRILVSILPFLLFIVSCSNQSETNSDDSKAEENNPKEISEVELYYTDHFQDSLPTKSIGTVGRGSIENATLIPYSGTGYVYFDTSSYLGGRAFTHQAVAQTVVSTFEALHTKGEKRTFRVMEFSNQHGGKMWPHRTHQNGMSVDLMMPLKQNGKTCYALDSLGATHYLLDFNKEGEYEKDASIIIDFDLVAKEILELDLQARKHGLKIKKVIFNTDLRDELFASTNGKRLQSSGIYVTRNLEKIINDLHDDHFHVDFEIIH